MVVVIKYMGLEDRTAQLESEFMKNILKDFIPLYGIIHITRRAEVGKNIPLWYASFLPLMAVYHIGSLFTTATTVGYITDAILRYLK